MYECTASFGGPFDKEPEIYLPLNLELCTLCFSKPN